MGSKNRFLILDADDARLSENRRQCRQWQDVMPKRSQSPDNVRVRRLLDFQAVMHVGKCLAKQKTRLCQSLFGRHAVVEQACEHQRQCLRLAIRPLCSVKQIGGSILERDARVEGIEGPLSRLYGVRMAACNRNAAPRFCQMTPVSPTTTPLPQSKYVL